MRNNHETTYLKPHLPLVRTQRLRGSLLREITSKLVLSSEQAKPIRRGAGHRLRSVWPSAPNNTQIKNQPCAAPA